MAVELKILALGAVLLFIHIFTATRFKTAQYGRQWNVSARDETLPPPNPIAGRTSQWTAIGGWTWLGARLIYLPIYAAGIPVVRTIVWAVALIGLGMVIKPLLVG